VWGWGLPWVVLRWRLADVRTRRVPFDIIEPFCGLAVLAGMATWLNLWQPLDWHAIWGVWGAGLVLLAIRVRFFGWRLGLPSWRLAAGGVGWLLIVIFAGNRAPAIYDTGLYHLQSMTWISTARALPGLANLHVRLAFAPVWFPLATLLQPLADSALSANLLTVLLSWLYGLAAWLALREIVAGHRPQANIFLALGLLMLATPLAGDAVTSPSADWAIVLVTTLCVWAFLQTQEKAWPLTVGLGALSLLAIFGAAIKISAIPLLLLPAALILSNRSRLKSVEWVPLSAWVTGLAAWVILPGLIRSAVLSGCLAFPVAITCLPQVVWRVPPRDVIDTANWILSWARWPGLHRDVTLTGWSWLGPWWARVSTQSDLVVPLVLLAGGMATLGLATLKRRPLGSGLAAAGPLVAGIAYWFFTAPYVRFGVGYFWALGLLAVSAGAVAWLPDGANRRLRLAPMVLLNVGVGLCLLTLVLPSVADGRARPSTAVWLQWPVVPSAPRSQQLTAAGIAVWIPDSPGAQCWLAPLPCTPNLAPNLRFHFDPEGHYQWF